MTNTTETYWDVNGVSLQTLAFNITTLGGDRMAPPPVRGEAIEVPFMPGTIWTPKVPDARVITLGMWVQGANEDGTIPIEEGARRRFEQNWLKLRKLLWQPRRQFTLTKRFWVPEEDLTDAGVVVDDLPRSGLYRLISASAKASFADGLSPSMTGPGRASFTVDLRLDDPYFYSDALTINLSMASGGANPGPTRNIEILGDDRTTDIALEFTGPLSAPRIENATHGVWMRYNTSVADGVKASANVRAFQARHDLTGTVLKSSGYVQHGGDPFWLFLEPGVNQLKLTATSGTGVVKMTYRPGWL